MNINSINNLNFGAKYIQDAQVKKYNPNKNTYDSLNVSFVEMDPDNIEDLFAINDTVRYWYNEKYASNIAYSLYLLRDYCLPRDSYKVYALTTQKDKLDLLNVEEILALGEVVEKTPKKTLELNYLQVDPKLVYSSTQRDYKDVGTAFLNVLKNLDKVKSIVLTSACSAVGFYKKNDFKLTDVEHMRFIWKKRKI